MIVKILSGAMLACLLTIGIQQWRIQLSNQRIVTLQSAVLTFQSAQTTNLATIKALQAANADWASKCAANQPEAREQAQLSAQGDAKRQAAAQKSIESLRATYEHEPTVKAWASVPLPRVVADRLREAGDPY